jgi:DNA-3-methyladenine glycosylase II
LLIAGDRPNVFPSGDLALRRCVRRLHGLDHLPSENEVLALAERWPSYRGLVAAYLFESEFEHRPGPVRVRPE